MDVTQAWTSIELWAAHYSPATLRALEPPCFEDRLRRAESETGLVWPDDLVASLRAHDGAAMVDIFVEASPLGGTR